MYAQDGLHVRLGNVADLENAGLRDLDQENGLLADLGRDGHRQDRLENAIADGFAAGRQRDFDLRRVLQQERLRGTGIFQRQILDVDALDGEDGCVGGGLGGGARSGGLVVHACS